MSQTANPPTYRRRWGWPGLQINGKYIAGDTPDCGKSASPDQDEIDVTLQYKPKAEKFKGLSLRLRGAWIDQQDSCNAGDAHDVTDFRVIVNYEFAL